MLKKATSLNDPGDPLPILDLPLDRPRRGKSRLAVMPVTIALNELAGLLCERCAAQDVSALAVVAAGFAVVLARYAGADDLIIGVAGSLQSIAVRLRLSQAATFADVVTLAEQQIVESESDGELTAEDLGLRATLGGELPPSRSASASDMHLSVSTSGGFGELFYDESLFERATIERLGANIVTFLRAALAAPHAPFRQLPMQSAQERETLLQWEAARSLAVTEETLPAIFARSVREHGNRIAVEDGTPHTYRELDALAAHIARVLAPLLSGDRRVGLCATSAFETVAAIVAIAKAGATYVPLDPNYPPARLATMIADARLDAIVTNRANAHVLPGSAHVIDLDLLLDGGAVADPGSHGGRDELAVTVRASDPAYIIYTSGTTGTPNGVVVEGRSLASYLAAFRECTALTADDRILQLNALGFDASIEEIFSALGCGATLVIPPRDVIGSVRELLEFCERAGVTILDAPTGYFHEIAAALRALPDMRLPPSLRLAVVGGEALLHDRAHDFLLRANAHVRLINMYGPTETTIVATAFEVDRQRDDATRIVPIGRPMANVRCAVRDDAGDPLPIGAFGELLIGGAGVARGYHDRAQLTSDRFIVDPFIGRAYRTGDIVRYRSDGVLEYRGRRDGQRKIRGFRVEIDEVRAILMRHPDVHDAAVALAGDTFVAGVVCANGAAEPELAAYLAARLPAFALPDSIVALSAIPLTHNGKIDQAAIVAQARSESGLLVAGTSEDSASSTARLTGIWEDVLHRRVEPDDNFFVLGGSSLIAARMLTRLEAETGIRLSFRELFERPTVAALAALADSRTGVNHPRAPASIAIAEEAPFYATSSIEQSLWYLQALLPDGGHYNVPVAWRLRGALDRHALERAFIALIARHPALRTRFPLTSGVPAAVIDDGASFALAYATFDGEDDAPARALAEAERSAWKPFDLQSGPLVRASLIRIAADDHVLALVFHHIVVDGLSFVIIERELGALYALYASASAAVLPPPPALRSVDFAVLQREREAAGAFWSDLAYWRERLGDPLPALDLPYDHMTRDERFAGDAVTHQADDLAAPLGAFCRLYGITPFAALSAAFGVLLGRYTGEGDVTIGFPTAGRLRPEFDGVVGCFVNTLPLRLRLDGASTFAAAAAHAGERIAEALDHQEIPFDVLVRELNPQRRRDRNPLVEVMLTVEDATAPVMFAGLDVTPIALRTHYAKFDLDLGVFLAETTFACTLEYDTSVFDRATAERLVANLFTLLRGAFTAPETPIAHLPLLSPAERAIVERWETPLPAALADETVTAIVASTVREYGDRIAVVDDGGSHTYAELDERASAIATSLVPLLGASRRVGLCAPSSFETIAAILGILKAGAAYVPLDPSYPPARLATIAADAELDAIVTHRIDANVLPSAALLVELRALAAVAQPGATARYSATLPQPSDAAYLIYTSGSTGTPNGVVVEHRALASYVGAFRSFSGAGAGDRMVQMNALGFDASLEEIFGALASGAMLFIPPRDVAGNVHSFLAYCEQHAVTVLNTPTAYFHEIAAALRALPSLAVPGSVRLALVGGEALSGERASDFLARAGAHVRLINTYGPTEATIVATVFTAGLHADQGVSVPIGRPVENVWCAIHDRTGERVPIGVFGELVIGGNGLARGYHNRPQLTAERFVDAHGLRVYRTGDIVRYRPDGIIEYRGRRDGQRKIRGFRVETQEIVAALTRYPGVRDAAVAFEDGSFVAAIVPAANEITVTERALAAYLAERLPPYALPNRILTLDALPKTAGGKIDERAIAALGRTSGGTVAPADAESPEAGTVLSKRLATIWEEVLHRPVGVFDDFFESGGHSLAAARMLTLIEAETGVALPLHVLFERPTIASLEEALYEDWTARETLDIVHEAERPGAPIFFIHAAPYGGLYTRSLARRFTVNRPLAVLEVHGAFSRPMPPTVEAMADDYVGRIRAIQPRGPYILAGYCQGGYLMLEVARMLTARGESVADVIALETSAVPFIVAPVIDAIDSARRLMRIPHRYTAMISAAVQHAFSVLERLRDPARCLNALGRLLTGKRSRRAFDATPRGRREEIEQRIFDVCSEHRPRRYTGRVTVISAADESAEPGAITGWKRIAPSARFVETPGNHLSVITVHLEDFAAVLSSVVGDDIAFEKKETGGTATTG